MSLTGGLVAGGRNREKALVLALESEHAALAAKYERLRVKHAALINSLSF